jgi:lysyl-tRNA synthetase class 2
LIIGGLDKIFEIGKQFRNEGLDATHHSEFTTCELYEAYSSLEHLYLLTEDFLYGLATTIFGHERITYQGLELNFKPPYRRIDIVPFLEERLCQSLPLDPSKLKR